MNRLLLLGIGLGMSLGSLAATTAPLAAQETKITYADQVQGVLRSRCATCHNSNKRSGDLDVTNFNSLMQGGSSGPVLKPGDAAGSYLYRLINHDDEPSMPPDASKLPQAELDLIAQWIDGGLLETSSSKALGTPKKKLAANSTTNALTRPENPVLPGHLVLEPHKLGLRATAVPSLATAPWSPLVAIAGAEQVLLYRTDTLELAGVLPFPEGTPAILKFSRDGALLIAGGGRGAARGVVAIWDVRSGERIATVGDEFETVLAADISNDHRLVALGGPGRLIKIYSAETGQLIHEIKKHTDWVTALEFSPDGVLLATGDRTGGLFVWEAATGRDYLTLAPHAAAVTGISWRLDSNLLATCSEDTTVRLWEVENGGQVKNWGAHGGGVQDLTFTRDGNLLTCGRDQATKLWDQNGGQIRAMPNMPDIAVATAFCNETQRVFTADWQGNLSVFNAADAAPLGSLAVNPPTLQTRLQTAQTEAAAKEAEQTQLTQSMNSMQTQLTTMQQALDQARQTMTQRQTELTTLQTQKQTMEASVTTWTAEKTGFETELAKSNEALPLLQTAATNAVEAAKRLPDSADLQTAASSMGQQLQQLEQRIADFKVQIETRTKQLNETQAAMVKLNEQMGQVQTALTTATAETQKMETEMQPVRQQFEALTASVAQVASQLQGMQSQVARWQSEISFVETLKALQVQLNAAEEVVANQQAGVAAAEAKVAEAQSALQAAQATLQSSQQAADAIRAQIDAVRSGAAATAATAEPVSMPAAPAAGSEAPQ